MKPTSRNRALRSRLAKGALLALLALTGAAGCESILGIGDLKALPDDGGIDSSADSSLVDGAKSDAGANDASADDASSVDATFDATPPPPDASGLGLEAYIKASNTPTAGIMGALGQAIALSGDGNTLVIGANGESSNGTSQTDTSAPGAGAAYVFARVSGVWTQTAYLKASNSRTNANFGQAVAISTNGSIIVVSAPNDSSNATGVNGLQTNTSDPGAGAVYVFLNNAGVWSQTAYLKASNTIKSLDFGGALALSGDGQTIAVGAYNDASLSAGINGSQAPSAGGDGAGSVYVFSTKTANGVGWSQQAYVKASNPIASEYFAAVSLSSDGNTLAVGAFGDSSGATGVNGSQTDTSATLAGAAYIFTRSAGGVWTQTTYVKSSNTRSSAFFGFSVSLSASGSQLAVGSYGESGTSAGVDGDQNMSGAGNTGAVYTFTHAPGGAWTQDAYVKASNPQAGAYFGFSLSLSPDGNELGVGAFNESSGATGINAPDASDTSTTSAGSAYFFTRHAGATWTQRDYVKAENARANAQFGYSVALDGIGDTFAVGSLQESSGASGVNPTAPGPEDTTAPNAGAAYVYR